MASSTPQGAFFGGFGTQSSDKKKSETYKIPDNPYVSQRLTTSSRNENAIVLKTSTNHHDASLRQRRPLQEQQQQPQQQALVAKPTPSFNPPKASLSLRTSQKSIPMDQTRSQVSLEAKSGIIKHCCRISTHTAVTDCRTSFGGRYHPSFQLGMLGHGVWNSLGRTLRAL